MSCCECFQLTSNISPTIKMQKYQSPKKISLKRIKSQESLIHQFQTKKITDNQIQVVENKIKINQTPIYFNNVVQSKAIQFPFHRKCHTHKKQLYIKPNNFYSNQRIETASTDILFPIRQDTKRNLYQIKNSSNYNHLSCKNFDFPSGGKKNTQIFFSYPQKQLISKFSRIIKHPQQNQIQKNHKLQESQIDSRSGWTISSMEKKSLPGTNNIDPIDFEINSQDQSSISLQELTKRCNKKKQKFDRLLLPQKSVLNLRKSSDIYFKSAQSLEIKEDSQSIVIQSGFNQYLKQNQANKN